MIIKVGHLYLFWWWLPKFLHPFFPGQLWGFPCEPIFGCIWFIFGRNGVQIRSVQHVFFITPYGSEAPLIWPDSFENLQDIKHGKWSYCNVSNTGKSSDLSDLSLKTTCEVKPSNCNSVTTNQYTWKWWGEWL